MPHSPQAQLPVFMGRFTPAILKGTGKQGPSGKLAEPLDVVNPALRTLIKTVTAGLSCP